MGWQASQSRKSTTRRGDRGGSNLFQSLGSTPCVASTALFDLSPQRRQSFDRICAKVLKAEGGVTTDVAVLVFQGLYQRGYDLARFSKHVSERPRGPKPGSLFGVIQMFQQRGYNSSRFFTASFQRSRRTASDTGVGAGEHWNYGVREIFLPLPMFLSVPVLETKRSFKPEFNSLSPLNRLRVKHFAQSSLCHVGRLIIAMSQILQPLAQRPPLINRFVMAGHLMPCNCRDKQKHDRREKDCTIQTRQAHAEASLWVRLTHHKSARPASARRSCPRAWG